MAEKSHRSGFILHLFTHSVVNAHPAIINNPPKGVTGPSTFPTFSLARTSAKILPENMIVPLMISGAAHLVSPGVLRRSKDGLALYTPTARRASPLYIMYDEPIDQELRDRVWSAEGSDASRERRAWDPNAPKEIPTAAGGQGGEDGGR
jgi:hypothetical protein